MVETKTGTPDRRRSTALGIVFGMVLAGGTGAQAQTDPPPPQPLTISTVCTPEDVDDTGFVDVADDNLHRRAIDCVVRYGIASGTTATTYDPGQSVRRDQMATFVARLIDTVGESDGNVPKLPPGGTDPFPCDLPPADNVHFDNIARLVSAELVNGGPGGLEDDCFGPNLLVTRAQMATFIDRAVAFVGRPIVEEANVAFTDYYTDDDVSPHQRNINAITSEGIAAGVGRDAGGNYLYGPRAGVRRDQMASFLARTLSYLADHGLAIAPPPPPPSNPSPVSG
ncbi:MAG: S-layer homology domain-containing protein [Actinomycetota bacterium]|nr:S-layer homology domain-containing protein [Actinomycetota bacterium]